MEINQNDRELETISYAFIKPLYALKTSSTFHFHVINSIDIFCRRQTQSCHMGETTTYRLKKCHMDANLFTYSVK